LAGVGVFLEDPGKPTEPLARHPDAFRRDRRKPLGLERRMDQQEK
jgi:hypothetical protein